MPIFSEMVSGKFYVGGVKPFFDILFAVILGISLVPFSIIISLIVWLNLRRPPIFIQSRIGKNHKSFKCYKFRTMRVDGDESTTSAFGKLMRSTSVDELPQILNVIKGKMSFVGPRPLLPEYLPFYNAQEQKRHLVKPGLTGWAQVNGRNAIDWGARMEKDIFYIEHISLGLDIKILLLTVMVLIKTDKTPYKNEPTVKFSDYASKR